MRYRVVVWEASEEGKKELIRHHLFAMPGVFIKDSVEVRTPEDGDDVIKFVGEYFENNQVKDVYDNPTDWFTIEAQELIKLIKLLVKFAYERDDRFRYFEEEEEREEERDEEEEEYMEYE